MSEPSKILQDTIFTTSRGLEVRILGVPATLTQRMIEGYSRRNLEPQPPTYKVAVGDPEAPEYETHAHNETTLETEEDKKAWKEYIQAHNDWQLGQDEMIAELFVHRGIAFDVPDSDDWINEQFELAEALGLDEPEIPEGKLALRRYYLETEGVSNALEYRTILNMVSAQAFKGLDLEAMRIVQDRMFRRKTQG